MIWENAYSNTTKVHFGIGKKTACKKCNEITSTKATNHRQILGNCFQIIVECQSCKNHFVQD